MQHVVEFIGRLHPAIVHLPIGIIILFSILVWVRQRVNISHEALLFVLASGAFTALLSVVTGLILSRDGEYNESTISLHQWLGIATTVVSILFWFILRGTPEKEKLLKVASLFILLLVVLTGHIGNDLVRGSRYLLEPFSGDDEEEQAVAEYTGDIREALLYQDIVQPILRAKCYNCHGEQKQKGKLRLDLPERILSGGENGKIITPGSAGESELIERVTLPLDDDDHMPPKERKQLTAKEILWIRAWIDHGAGFDGKVSVVLPPALVASIQAPADETDNYNNIEVTAPDANVIEALTQKGVAVSAIADGSPLLQVNFVSAQSSVDSLLQVATRLGPNVVILKLGSTGFTDAGGPALSEFRNLRRLSLEDTKITDALLAVVAKLEHLTYLNLNDTGVTANGIMKLGSLTKLRSLFLYHTAIEADEVQQLQSQLPSLRIELGGYQVPTLPSDTTVLTPR